MLAPQLALAPDSLLDTIGPALAAFALRRLRLEYVGPLVNLRESSGGKTQDFYPLASGAFPVAQALAFANGASLSIATWYDQSGNGINLTQGTTASQPVFTSSSALIGGKPTASFTASALRVVNPSVATTAQPYSMLAVAARTGSFTSFSFIFGTTSANPVLDFSNSANTVRFTAGSNQTTAVSDSAAHCIGAAVNAASSIWCIDGTTSAFAGSPGTNSLSTLGIGAYTNGGNPLTGIVAEAILLPRRLSADLMRRAQSNQKSYYGTA